MSKLIITKGLPRSGKSTWAKEHVEKSGNYVRINRDDLRVMLHNDKWSPKNEEITIATQRAMVKAALLKGKSVIVDDTNLTDHHKLSWEALAKECDATFEVKKFDSTDIQLLIDRDFKDLDSKRGESVIVKLAMQHGYIYHQDDSLVLCDLDGTLCDIRHRLHFVKGKCELCSGDSKDGKACFTTTKEKEENTVVTHQKKDWDGFFAGLSEDTIREDVLDMLKEYVKQGKKIVFVTARPERCREDTENWLWRHNISSRYDTLVNDNALIYEAVVMRHNGDSRDDTLVKGEMLTKYFRPESIHVVIDDRPAVIRMWRSNNITVIDVGSGVEF